MFTQFADLRELKKHLVSKENYHPFPRIEEREAWDNLPEDVKKQFLDRADEVLAFESPALSATRYMEWYRTNTTTYESISQPRREMLYNALIIECIENKGRMIDKIIDIVWAICEETSWVAPSHNNHMHNYMWSGVLKNALPDIEDENFIDLRSGFTAALMANVYYFLKDKLDAETPLVCKRIEYELKRRVEKPFMSHDDMTWMGFYGHKINNWNPVIIACCLFAALAVTSDPQRRLELTARYFEKLDIYADQCLEDGGCDEGPGYWDMAGASLIDNAEIIAEATGGWANVLKLPMMKNTAEFRMQMTEKDRLVNFADCGSRAGVPDSVSLARFARETGSERLLAFAHDRYQKDQAVAINSVIPYRSMKSLFERRAFEEEQALDYQPADHWYPDLQVLLARSNDERVFMAAKAGFNNESHNHNDMGSFVVYVDGKPILVDVGNEAYTAITFSPYRYTIWCLQSNWHSTVQLNGFEQHAGDEYRATEVSGGADAEKAFIDLRLDGAFEAAANVSYARRRIELDKTSGAISVTDADDAASVQLHFITCTKPEVGEGYVDLAINESESLRLSFDRRLACSIDEHVFTDEGMKKGWQTDRVYRVRLNAGESTREQPYITEIKLVNR